MARKVNGLNWKRSDFITLGKAVSSFNKSISKLEGKGINLPDTLNYSKLKKDITTRQELNRVINSLKRFNKPSQQLEVSINGIKITQWELSEVKKAKKRAERRLLGEKAGLESISTFGTGNAQLDIINSMLDSYDKVFDQQLLSDYRRISKSIMLQGRTDFEYRQAKIFQESFIKAYEEFGRTEIVEFARSFKNPEDFWEAIKSSELADLKQRYDVEEGRMQLAMSKDDSYYSELQKLGII